MSSIREVRPDLLAMGLIRSSFVPPAPIQDLRDLTRTRKQLVREIARHTQRIQKTLEDANVKLTEAISDILGTSGRAMLKALMTGVPPMSLGQALQQLRGLDPAAATTTANTALAQANTDIATSTAPVVRKTNGKK